jgi:hypothetical protein
MNKNLEALMAMMSRMQPKETAKERRQKKDRRHLSYVPPRPAIQKTENEQAKQPA